MSYFSAVLMSTARKTSHFFHRKLWVTDRGILVGGIKPAMATTSAIIMLETLAPVSDISPARLEAQDINGLYIDGLPTC